MTTRINKLSKYQPKKYNYIIFINKNSYKIVKRKYAQDVRCIYMKKCFNQE